MGRKLAIVRVSPELLVQCLDLPRTTDINRIYTDDQGRFCLEVEDPSLPEVKPTEEIPLATVFFEKVTCHYEVRK